MKKYDSGMRAVTLVLPAYNEAEQLEDTVNKTIDALKNITDSFEIILAEDGSTDGTDKIAEVLAKKHRFVQHLHSDDRLGRGGSLKRAFKKSTGKVLAYIDVDLSTDMSHLKELVDAVSVEDFDIATGSRMLPQSNVKRPIKRSIASACFNVLIRLLLKSGLYDHQCGFKSFKRESLFKLIDDIEDEGWFWDTELLVVAQKRGYRVKEFPVMWRQCARTKVHLISDVTGMGSQIIRMWLQRRGKR